MQYTPLYPILVEIMSFLKVKSLLSFRDGNISLFSFFLNAINKCFCFSFCRSFTFLSSGFVSYTRWHRKMQTYSKSTWKWRCHWNQGQLHSVAKKKWKCRRISWTFCVSRRTFWGLLCSESFSLRKIFQSRGPLVITMWILF